jgi:SAM-dependent methyltransferase
MRSPLEVMRYLRWRAGRVWRRHMDPTKRWRLELRREVAFWNRIVEGGSKFPAAWERRSDPNAPLTERLILDRLDLIDTDPVSILDVGAGPMTILGTKHPQRRLEITATDPLADDYSQMLDEAGIEPPVRTQLCRGEDLVEHFGADRFDMVYSRNAVDHSVDPLTILRNMVGVTKPGGFVLLRHFQNEGVDEDYEGLHQWNFDLRDGRLLLWNPRETHDLQEVFAEEVELWAELQPWTDRPAPWVACAMRKRRPGGDPSLP